MINKITINNFSFLVFAWLIISLTWSCKESDDTPPIITINGADTVVHTLNELYLDQGAKAIDDTDGDISSNVFVDNTVNENKAGIYTVTYKAVDQAGNEAIQVARTVYVINSGWTFAGIYEITETQVWPEQQNCNYFVGVNTDSTLNNRMNVNNLNCESGQEVFFDILDSVIIAPFQILEDSLISMSLQGSGFINDSAMFMEYTKTSSETTSLWQVDFVKQK